MKPLHKIFLVLFLFVLTSCGQAISPFRAVPTDTSVSPTVNPIPSTPIPLTTTNTPLPEPVFYTNPVTYDVTYTVIVQNGGFTITDLRVYQPRLVEWDNQKNVVVNSVSPHPASESVDPVYGNGIYYWKLSGQPASGSAQPFTFEADVTVYEVLTQIDPAAVQPYNTSDSMYTLYTRAEKFIEADDPAMIELAGQVAGGEQNPYLIARKFYDYIIQNFRFKSTNQGLLGAKAFLEAKKGEAGDFAALFVALCRVKGIPARPVVGAVAQSGTDASTVWAEFYLEPLGWIPVDVERGLAQPEKRDYYFGNMDNERIILNKGYNIPLTPAAPDNFVAAYLQVPFYWFWGSSGDANKVTLERSVWTVTKLP
jgi:transglutaminase-like putative cysteine protease